MLMIGIANVLYVRYYLPRRPDLQKEDCMPFSSIQPVENGYETFKDEEENMETQS